MSKRLMSAAPWQFRSTELSACGHAELLRCGNQDPFNTVQPSGMFVSARTFTDVPESQGHLQY